MRTVGLVSAPVVSRETSKPKTTPVVEKPAGKTPAPKKTTKK